MTTSAKDLRDLGPRDLVEHVADLSRNVPIFFLCVARTELLDLRPGWGGGKLNATSLLLEPLSPDACDDLIASRVRTCHLRDERRHVERLLERRHLLEHVARRLFLGRRVLCER